MPQPRLPVLTHVASFLLIAALGCEPPPARTADAAGVPKVVSAPPAPPVLSSAAEAPERPGVIERNGSPRTLVGPELAVGDLAPPFDLVDPELGRVRSTDFAGRVLLLSVVPSIDTPVCEAQTGRLAAEQENLGDVATLLTVSRDLPFAHRRFLADNQIDILMASDFDAASFAKAWGLYIKETGLIARSLWVVGKDGKIAYRQIVREQSTEPDYEPALSAAKAAGEAP